MRKTTGHLTATTFTLVEQHPTFRDMDDETRADIAQPYVWKSEGHARDTIRTMIDTNGFEHTAYFAPGLEVHAFYVNGAMLTVIVIEDDDVAQLHTAIRRERPVTFGYTKICDGADTVRTIEPKSLKVTSAGSVILRGLDRRSGLYRSFRVDAISDYTVHRSHFVLDEAHIAVLAGIREAEARASVPVVMDTRTGRTGMVEPGSRAFGPAGWSVTLKLTGAYRNLTPTGSVRVLEDRLAPATA